MEIISREILNDLSQARGVAFVSIYMPTHRFGQGIQQDPIRLKNLLTKAEGRLQEFGLQGSEIKELLAPCESLMQDALFWQDQSDGLAIFVKQESMVYYRLPVDFDELVVISERFHIKPLVPLVSTNGHYYVLTLSLDQVKLFEGSLFNLDEIDLENLPTSLGEALRYDDPERSLQFHTRTAAPGSAGERPSSFHGQGAIEDDAKKDILRYFHQVNDGLMTLLADEHAPLVLAGVDYLLPIYRRANNYPKIVEESIEGNPDRLSTKELHRAAWEILEPIFNEVQRQAMARFKELNASGSDLASDRLDSVIPAAHFGRVDTLFVSIGAQIWGWFDASKNALEVHQEFHPGDQDLLDLACVQTMLKGGKVYAIEQKTMPNNAQLAAIYRYTIEG